MIEKHLSPVRRFVRAIIGLLPDGGVDDDSFPPDIDGRRDTDNARRRASLEAKSQLSPHGQGTTSYETVDRGPGPSR